MVNPDLDIDAEAAQSILQALLREAIRHYFPNPRDVALRQPGALSRLHLSPPARADFFLDGDRQVSLYEQFVCIVEA